MISFVLNLWRFVLWPSMWFTLDNVPYALEKNDFLGMQCSYILILYDLMYNLRPVFPYLFSIWMIYPLIYGLLKFPTIIVLASLFIVDNFCSVFLGASKFGVYVFIVVILVGLILLSLCNVLVSCYKVYFVSYIYIATPGFISMEHLFSIVSLSVCICL